MLNYASVIEEIRMRDSSWSRDLLLVLFASCLICLFAPIAIKLPFTCVPIATQPHVVLALACLLGSRRAFLAVLAFIFEGAMGLPVFSKCASGMLHLCGPTGGYLIGYLFAALLTGYLVENFKEKTTKNTFWAMVAGNVIIYAFGLPHLATFIGWRSAIVFGMLPFLVGDLLKIVVALRGLKALKLFRADADEVV